MKIFKSIKVFSSAVIILSMILGPVSAQESSKFSDAEVASIALTVNRINITYAEIANKRSKNPGVLELAKNMTNDHKTVIAQASAFIKKLNVTFQEYTTSKKLLAAADKTIWLLQSEPSESFNMLYIDNEISYHRVVIITVNDLLIPERDNNELKQLLQNVIRISKTHLEHALMVQEIINNEKLQ